MKTLFSIFMIFSLNSCSKISQPPQNPSIINVSALVALGPISGGNVTIYRLSDGTLLNTSITKTIELSYSMVSPTTNLLYKDAKAGEFRARLNIPGDMSDEDLLQIVVTGGQDIDADDDFIIYPHKFKKLSGKIIAITTLADVKSGKVVINALSTLAAKSIGAIKSEPEIKNQLSKIARKLLSTELFDTAEKGDINGDKIVDFADIALFNPKQQQHGENAHYRYLKNLDEYKSLLPSASGALSFIDGILDDDENIQAKFSTNLSNGYLYSSILLEIIEDISGNANARLITSEQLNLIAGVSGATDEISENYLLEFRRRVKINDVNNPSKQEIENIQLSINNINTWVQNTPQWIGSQTISMNEGNSFVAQLSATDIDENDNITFNIIAGDDKNLFNLNENGKLFFKENANFSNPLDKGLDNNYQIIIAINDLAGNVNTQTFNITVLNVLEKSKVLSKIINEKTPLTVNEYSALGLIVDVGLLHDMNILLRSKSANEIDNIEKIKNIFDFVNLPIVLLESQGAYEGQDLVFKASLSKTALMANLDCETTNNGSSSAIADFVNSSAQITGFPNNFNIQTLVDSIDEGRETVIIRCKNLSGLRFVDILANESSFSGTIFDNIVGNYVPIGMTIDTPIQYNITSSLDIRGIIDSPISIFLPYNLSKNSSVSLAAYSKTLLIDNATLSEQGENNIYLTFSWNAETLNASGKIKATVTLDDSQSTGIGANDGSYKLKGLSITDNSMLLANFDYPLNNAGQEGSFSINIVPWISDRNFGDGVHDFLYLPITSPNTGRIWLNNNLGANYSNTQHSSFNLSKQAASYNDIDAYGSLFQWGRLADGHELIDWKNNASVYQDTDVKSAMPKHNLFIKSANDPNDWSENANDKLWLGKNAINNVCPQNYRLPSTAEFKAEKNTWNENNRNGAFANNLKLTTAGYRHYKDATLEGKGKGYYWQSDTNSNKSKALYFSASTVFNGSKKRASGYSVRCIKD